MPGYEVRPIGHVENSVTDLHETRWEDFDSKVVVDAEYADGLEGIEEFSHIVVLGYLHRQGDWQPGDLRVHPERRTDLPLVGVFATRSPHRPSPIGITVVPLLKREGNVLWVRGLDMANGTPVIDLKPYLPLGDRGDGARVPEWMHRLWDSMREGGE